MCCFRLTHILYIFLQRTDLILICYSTSYIVPYRVTNDVSIAGAEVNLTSAFLNLEFY